MSNSHGIRAVPSEGTRFRATSNQLSKDNYTQWSGRLKGILVVNKVWDLVCERRHRPAKPKAHSRDEENDEDLSTADIATENKYDAYIDDFNKAACLLVESISDSQLLAVTSVLDDPIAIWNKLQQKFARKSEMGKSAAQKALLNFQHLETETADETICRFEAVVERCEQQGVRIYDDELERALLDQPNERYEHLKKT